ncbi:DMT family transporter [Agromyces aerolatus]|uniref:DMT family transporter n=1 Tax=Agromyces sp. LY-1074 TaxID=3074080 RepID=UPI0028611DF7|nr:MULTISPECIES: DMT family transporter [unclassified Agromyces]MDR5701878.1 DMT family transporter [Agromyces sp. LY-1074]MDR5708108.1 DMT family transporter [Agromyces sp. LY-1358]
MSTQIGIPWNGIPGGWPVMLAGAGFVLSWSAGFWSAKLGAGEASVITLILWRYATVAVALWVAVWVARLETRMSLRELLHHSTVGLFSQAGYVLPVYGAIALGVSTGTTSLVDAIQPLVIATLVGPLLGLAVRRLQWFGLGVAFAGVVALVANDLTSSEAPALAYLLPAAAVASLVAGTLVERRAAPAVPVTVMLAVHTSVTAIVMLPIALVTGQAAPPADPGFWTTVAFLALVPTLAAYGLYWFLLRRIDVTALNALLFLVVPTTTIGGVLLFGEPFTAVSLVGLALSGVGVAMVLRGEAPSAERRATPAARGRDR